jgi:predicted nucleic acid-binding protein
MNLILDANVLFAALIKEGKTIEILLNPSFNLYAPEFLFEEFTKYKDEILHKTHRNEGQFLEILNILNNIINLVPREEYADKIKIAVEISPDENDIDYFALALKLDCAIWSNDKRIKEQNKVKVYSTENIIEFLK